MFHDACLLEVAKSCLVRLNSVSSIDLSVYLYRVGPFHGLETPFMETGTKLRTRLLAANAADLLQATCSHCVRGLVMAVKLVKSSLLY